jgi:hypothetical protein
MLALGRRHPALGQQLQRQGIQEVQLLAPPPARDHQLGRLQRGQVFGQRLSRQRQPAAQHALRQARLVAQAIQQRTPRAVGQRAQQPVGLVVVGSGRHRIQSCSLLVA